jgi:glycosyltransferase involved in cell wall biosynthesis
MDSIRARSRAQMRALLQRVPLVLARSRSLFAALETWGCPPTKLRLNRTGIPLDDFPFGQRPLPADGGWRFIQASRLVAKKGLKTALRAFARFLADHPKAKFVIAGEGPQREELEDFAMELGIREAVEFCGFLAQRELAELYARSHFVHPSEVTRPKPGRRAECDARGDGDRASVLATLHGAFWL